MSKVLLASSDEFSWKITKLFKFYYILTLWSVSIFSDPLEVSWDDSSVIQNVQTFINIYIYIYIAHSCKVCSGVTLLYLIVIHT